MLPQQEHPTYETPQPGPHATGFAYPPQRVSLDGRGQDDILQQPPSMDFSRSGTAGYVNGPAGQHATHAPPPPAPPRHNGEPRHGPTMSLGGFEGSRSPPTKNTSHVPCKFFRLGQCQAGRACPFSHSMDITTSDAPCKYFAKGNCKFGQKCALSHILPDGRRVNRPNGVSNGNVPLGQRVDPQLYHQTDPALMQSLLAQQTNAVPPPFNNQYPTFGELEMPLQDGPQYRTNDQLAPKDSAFNSRPSSKFGSPREDSRYLSLSPAARLSVLDAPLPASFDSQGISYMARHGPVAASLPSKIGLFESSPPASLPMLAPAPLDSMSNLGQSSFATRSNRARGTELSSSPFNSGDEGASARLLHSRRNPKPKVLSTSMPRVDIPIEDSDDDAFHFSGGEEDYIPTVLHDQVFTRDEQQRRRSQTEHDKRSIRESLSGIGTPNDSSKVGSPTIGSPSRYGPLFARQTQQQQEANSTLATSPSAFGHIGSPLRNSSSQFGTSPSLRTPTLSGDMSPSFPSLSSPPRQSSMSMLSQQLSRSRISNRSSQNIGTAIGQVSGEAPGAHGSNFSSSNNAAPTPTSRNVSGGSQGQGQGQSRGGGGGDRFAGEEQNDTVFSMEDDFEENRKRHSGGHQVPNSTHSAGPSQQQTPVVAAPPNHSSQAPVAWSQIAARGASIRAPVGAVGSKTGNQRTGPS